jgi:exopolysaccharide biosynthesis polyprenyl glycosylphosphotransferase
MTPPAQQAALGATQARESAARLLFRQGDVVLLADLWAIVAFLWCSKVAWNLPNSVAVFALALFAVTAGPASEGRRLTPSAVDDAGVIARRVCVSFTIAFVVSLITNESLEAIRVLFYVAVPMIPVLVTARALAYAAEKHVRRKHRGRAVVLGGGFIGRRAVLTLQEHLEYGLDVVGVVDDDPRFASEEFGGAPIIPSSVSLAGLISDQQVDVVLVAFSAADQGQLVDTIREAQEAGAVVWLVPRFFELGAATKQQDHLWGLPVVRLNPPAAKRPEWVFKRSFDVAASVIGLVLFSPVMAAIAAAIVLESGRPVLFRQQRLGRRGLPFDILKFRSMTEVASELQETEWCDSAESRVTRVGRFIRATSFDELPQLFNVLKGDMSLVGPRPERPYFAEQFSDLYPGYGARARVPAGVTGWSQVNGLRGDTSIEERALFDNYYIENWSFGQDLKILLRTAKALFKG